MASTTASASTSTSTSTMPIPDPTSSSGSTSRQPRQETPLSDGDGGGYNINPGGRIKLKATKVETAQKIYKREIRRLKREQSKIDRANGLVSPRPDPPRYHHQNTASARDRSASPKRKKAATGTSENDPIPVDSDDEAPPSAGARTSWAESVRNGNTANGDDDDVAAKEREREAQERLRWMMEEELVRDDPFAAVNSVNGASLGGMGMGMGPGGVGWGYVQPTPDTAIPARYRATGPGVASSHRPTRVDAMGAIPDMAGMTEEEYAASIREGFERKRALEERDILDKQRARAQQAEYQRILAEEAESERLEAQRRARLKKEHRERKAQKAAAEAARKAKAEQDVWVFDDFKKTTREHYRARWAGITAHGEIEEWSIGFGHIPWPVYYPGKPMGLGAIREFMRDLAREEGVEMKKVLREGIRQFHPDRFFGRILPRTKEEDRERVREGVEVCSRAINDLLGEVR